jgi:hypothetical protein
MEPAPATNPNPGPPVTGPGCSPAGHPFASIQAVAEVIGPSLPL